jgi:hypothetical protein
MFKRKKKPQRPVGPAPVTRPHTTTPNRPALPALPALPVQPSSSNHSPVPEIRIPDQPFISGQARSPRLGDGDWHREVNAQRDMRFIQDLYARYYKGNGARRALPEHLRDAIYVLMGESVTDYFRDPVTVDDLQAFLEETGGKFRLYPQKPNLLPEEALKDGDYFHVENTDHRFPSDTPFFRLRRLVVNYRSQRTGLHLARHLTPFFAHSVVGQYFTKFKMLLMSTARSSVSDKNDKMVLYYYLGHDLGDQRDWVGDLLTASITGNLPDGEGDMSVSPFYSRITNAVSWAEDPSDYGYGNVSVTMHRRDIVQKVIEVNDQVESADELARLVFSAFEEYGVPPSARHRHLVDLPGAATDR